MVQNKSWRVRLTLVLAGPLLVLLALEVTARVWLGSHGEEFSNQFWILDPELGSRMRPGYEGLDDHGLAVSISSLGLRNSELESAPSTRRPRVLALGDSVTYGFGVEASEAYPRLLEAELSARGREFEIVNAGVAGYSTFQGLRFLERDLLELQPDVVLFAFMNNDRWDSRGKVHSAEGMRLEYARRGRRAWFFYHTALGRIALRFLAGGLEGALKTPAARREVGRDVVLRQERDVVLPPPLALEPVDAGDPRLADLETLRTRLATVGLVDRAALCERLVDLSEQHGFRLVFLNFYDHGYMCEPLRRAFELVQSGAQGAALTQVQEYFATAPVPRTSGRRLMDFDLYANRLLVDIYDGLGTAADAREFYFTRRPFKRLLLHLDLEVNGVATRVAERRGVEVLELRDLAFEDYLDHVHLTPRGHQVVAQRIAELLMQR